MLYRDWWRIETDYGFVELELDEAGVPLTDEQDIDETNKVLSTLLYAIKTQNPRVMRAVLEVYAQFHPERFPPGLSLYGLETRDIDPVREVLCGFLEEQVEAGYIRLFEDEIVMSPIERVAKLQYAPQPIV